MKAGKMALERALTHGRRLEDEVLSIQNQERARLARDLHDGICQNLGAVTFMLEMHMRQLAALGPESKPAQSGQKVREMLSHTLREMRGLSHELSGVETCAKGGERPGRVIGCSRVRGRLRSSRRLTALARLAP